MRVRVLSSVVGLILLIAITINQQVLSVTIFLLSLIGLYEFYYVFSKDGYKPVKTLGYLACLPLIFIGSNINTRTLTAFFFLIIALLLLVIVFKHKKYNIVDIAITTFGVLYIPFMFSFISLTRNLEGGKFYIWLIFIGAWATDSFAYFVGVSMGKTKILPTISPKKTLEGSIGGLIGCVITLVLYGFFIEKGFTNIPLYHYLIMGTLSGAISQLGDWSASAIKRNVNAKDYGKFMPGHGGVLDRFDSILFIAPVIYFYLTIII